MAGARTTPTEIQVRSPAPRRPARDYQRHPIRSLHRLWLGVSSPRFSEVQDGLLL
jgi:hypothetical protein